MKKIIAVGLVAAGLIWTLGQRKTSAPADTWAAGTDPV
jgi:hypothetical protein